MIGKIKHIIVIESLKEEDGIIHTGEALYNDTIKRKVDLIEKENELLDDVNRETLVVTEKYY